MIDDPVFKVSDDGVTAPTYEEIYEYFKGKAKEIFGSDVNLEADTADGQLIAIFAKAVSDVNSAGIAAYSAYNPQSAKGVALDAAVKTNGISRHAASHSTVDVKIIGQYGTVITDGIVIDTSQHRWALPERVTIPSAGEVTVTATAVDAGAISAPIGSVTTIGTPTRGWQSVTNEIAATVGVDVESDADLRYRQTLSTMQPTIGLWDGLIASVRQLDGVQSVTGRHNDTGSESSEGIPAHSIALVVDGGDADEIAEAIYRKKSQGVATYGSTSVEYIDSIGNVNTINFSRPTSLAVTATVTLKASDTWLSSNEDDVKERLADYINGLDIGEDVDYARCVAECVRETTTTYDDDFSLTALTLNGSAASVTVAWNEKAEITTDDITVTVE
jgi:uncharacterized phage protein gp47/JayE